MQCFILELLGRWKHTEEEHTDAWATQLLSGSRPIKASVSADPHTQKKTSTDSQARAPFAGCDKRQALTLRGLQVTRGQYHSLHCQPPAPPLYFTSNPKKTTDYYQSQKVPSQVAPRPASSVPLVSGAAWYRGWSGGPLGVENGGQILIPAHLL